MKRYIIVEEEPTGGMCLLYIIGLLIFLIAVVAVVYLVVIVVAAILLVAAILIAIGIAFLAGYFLGSLTITLLDKDNSRSILVAMIAPVLLAGLAFILVFVFQDNTHRIIAGLITIFFTGFSYKTIKEGHGLV